MRLAKWLEKRRRAARMIAAGKRVQEVCRREKCSIVFVRNACEEFGVPFPSAASRKTIERAARREAILKALREGVRSVPEICDRFKVSQWTVRHYMGECGTLGVRKKMVR